MHTPDVLILLLEQSFLLLGVTKLLRLGVLLTTTLGTVGVWDLVTVSVACLNLKFLNGVDTEVSSFSLGLSLARHREVFLELDTLSVEVLREDFKLLFGENLFVDTFKFRGDLRATVLLLPVENLKSLRELIQLTDKLGSAAFEDLTEVLTTSSSCAFLLVSLPVTVLVSALLEDADDFILTTSLGLSMEGLGGFLVEATILMMASKPRSYLLTFYLKLY